MLILASITVTGSINGTLFQNVGKAKFSAEIKSIADQIKEKQAFSEEIIEDEDIDEIIGIETGYDKYLLIQNGELVYDGYEVKKRQENWLKEMGIKEKKYTIGELVSEEEIKVGDYVKYIPDSGTYIVAGGDYGTGAATNQEFETQTGTNALEWRIWSIDSSKQTIELVSATEAQVLTLNGIAGYNHYVEILNDLCNNLYSKSIEGEKIAVARSISRQDINLKTTYDYTKYTNGTYTYAQKTALSTFGTSARKYPAIYEKVKGFAPGGIEQGGLDSNEGLNDGVVNEDGVTEYKTCVGYINDYDSTTNNPKKDVYITYTFYAYNIISNLNKTLGINIPPEDLIGLSTRYWLADRNVSQSTTGAVFLWSAVEPQGYVNGGGMVNSYANGADISLAVRPIVSFNKQVTLSKDYDKSTEEKTYWDITF